MTEAVNHPPHYNDHPSGVECIEIAEHMTFCLGNAFKYGWRYYAKAKPAEDLRKMLWYIEREQNFFGPPMTHEFRVWFRDEIMAPRRIIFNRPSPWCESVRWAMAALCDWHCSPLINEKSRLLDRAAQCIRVAIDDEKCFDGSGLAV